MIRGILIFLITCALVYGGIEGFRSLTGKQKWALTKSVGYSILVSTIALVILTAIVIAF